jgi:hypothetical protein
MDDTSNRPVLQVVGGKEAEGRALNRKRSGKLPNGLTVKQEAFAQALAKGLSNADAYRQAYDVSSMKDSSIHTESSKLATNPTISTRVVEIIEAAKRKNSIFTEKQREKHSDRIWRKMWDMIEDASTPPAVKANLLSLGAKAAGMLTEQVKIENVAAESKDIEKEIIERLQRLSA